jgi:hypothetical protein
MFDIKDRPGVISVNVMRVYFERGVKETETLAEHVPLDCDMVNGVFQQYTNPETHAMWVGFALGMRCAERIAEAMSGAGRATT